MLHLIDKLYQEQRLSEEEWVFLLESYTPEVLEYATDLARKVRDEVYGRRVFIRGLIEYTNNCVQDCLYCGIRRSNGQVRRYRLSEEEILASCEKAFQAGCRTFVLQGGEDPALTDEWLTSAIAAMKEHFPQCAITLSLGERSLASYAALRQAGADRYLLRHETADETHYEKLHPKGASLQRRMECLWDLKALGYQVGSGFMVGSPYQDARCIAQDMAFLHELKPAMVGIGPFISHKDTPFADKPNGSVELTLFLLACLRLMLPQALLPATTALNTLAGEAGYELGLNAGANVIMPNVTPPSHRKDYALYDKKACEGLEAAEGIQELEARLMQAGYEIVIDRGDWAGLSS